MYGVARQAFAPRPRSPTRENACCLVTLEVAFAHPILTIRRILNNSLDDTEHCKLSRLRYSSAPGIVSSGGFCAAHTSSLARMTKSAVHRWACLVHPIQ